MAPVKLRGPKTLAGQIQLRVAITVAAMAVVLAGLTLFVAQNLLIRQLDAEIEAIPLRARDISTNPRGAGIPRGTILVVRSGSGELKASVVEPGDVRRFDGSLDRLINLPDGRHSVDLPKIGRYRVLATQLADNSRIVIAMPMKPVQETILLLTVSALGISAVAVAGTVAVSQALISRATKPLGELTRTAAEVSDQRLDRGVVEVPRVPVVDQLPEQHEVAQVGASFNRMLNHVESALLARESSEAKLRRFVADASHELRNPLAAISGYSELAERHVTDLDADLAFALSRISAEAKRMRKLVEDLLVLARLDAHPNQQPEPVDAVEVVLNAVSDSRTVSPEHRWNIVLPDEPVQVLAGADQLQQVLVNLLGNARTHTPPGTTIEAAVTSDGLITVTDDGPGIPQELLPDVFARFTRADPARSYRAEHSTGLGLAIVKAQVESFGGSVAVESRPGHTQFRVWLPPAGLVAPTDHTESTGASEPHAPSDETSMQKKDQ